MREDWKEGSDYEEIEEKEKGEAEEEEERKTDNGWGPSGERRNTPFIDEGVQKCTDYRRLGGGCKRTGVLWTPSWDHLTTPGSSEGGRDVDGTGGCRRDGGEGERGRA